MPPIGPVHDLAARIRSEVAGAVRAAIGTPGRLAGVPHGDRPAISAHASPAEIAALVGRRVAAIDPADPQRRRRVFGIFLESVLLAEFGTGLINDAGFRQLVEEVHLQMEADTDLADTMRRAADRLLRTRRAP